MGRIRVLHAVTVSKSLKLMKGQLSYLKKLGYEVSAVSSPGKEIDTFAEMEKVNIKQIKMAREISPLSDIISLIKIIRFLLKYRPHIVNTGTPKAGLLLSIAAWLTRVPVRIYTVRGLRLETTYGYKRKILLYSERIACFCSHRVVAVSESLRKRMIELKLAPREKIIVLGSGSSNGIQVNKVQELSETKIDISLETDSFKIGFVGRITKDKGVIELLQAFRNLRKKYDNIKLLILGDFETGDPIPDSERRYIETDPKILFLGFQQNPFPYYKFMDIFVLPSHREGFANVCLEAALFDLPIITTNATGAIDTVIDGKTGLIYEVGNVKQLEEKIEYLIRNPHIRKKMGIEGKKRVAQEFSSERIWNELGYLYKTLLQEKGLK
ncbi:glycosyltransferase family 4 protein [Aeribacillus pallidus]|nr:glycosyltransferase family 4 protein [Aeribacillus pallidus]